MIPRNPIPRPKPHSSPFYGPSYMCFADPQNTLFLRGVEDGWLLHIQNQWLVLFNIPIFKIWINIVYLPIIEYGWFNIPIFIPTAVPRNQHGSAGGYPQRLDPSIV